MTRAFILLILLLAFGLRVWQLPALPAGYYYDESYNGMDALWFLQTGEIDAYLPGNTGRSVMMPLLGALSMTLLGPSPFAMRLVGVAVNVLLIAVLYAWAMRLFAESPGRRWLALLAAAGLGLSFWHVIGSRTSHESTLVPLFVGLTGYFFWRGLQSNRWWDFVGAGVALGLSQYAYPSARLLPVIIGGFVILWTLIPPANLPPAGGDNSLPLTGRGLGRGSKIKRVWIGTLITAASSAVVFIPLGLFILRDPDTFFFRSGDVFILNRVARGEASFLGVASQGLRLFIDSYSPTWRHNIVGESTFDWLNFTGFWLGLAVLLWRWRKPESLYIIIGLGVMWSPAFLSEGISNSRLHGLLPFYYLMMAVGLWTIAQGFSLRVPNAIRSYVPAAMLITVIGFSGSVTAYKHFVVWASEPKMYTAYHGPVTGVAREILRRAPDSHIYLPAEVYYHPTMRFMLHPHFAPSNSWPSDTRPGLVVEMSSVDMSNLVWLGDGVAYAGYSQNPEDLQPLLVEGERIPVRVPHQENGIATLIRLGEADLGYRLLAKPALKSTRYTWDNEIRLSGYEFQPQQVERGQASVLLRLTWEPLVGQPHAYTHFVQLVNGRGEAISQWTDTSFADQHRWGPLRPVYTQHRLWLSPEAEPGAYFVRFGLFNPSTGERIPVEGATTPDSVLLGPFYVITDDIQPGQPDIPSGATLGENIRLLGHSRDLTADELIVRLHWQRKSFSRESTLPNANYTVFVQLLDAQNNLVTSWDSPPFAGQYPTSQWQPGEILMDAFRLPLPDDLPPGEYHLVTGMYTLDAGRLPAYDDGTRLPDAMITLESVYFGDSSAE